MVRCPSAAPGRHPLALSRASWNAASRTKNSQLPVHDTCARPAAGFLGSLAALVGREAPAPRPGHGSHGPRMTLIDVSAALALAAALGGVAWLSRKRGRVRSRNTLLLRAFTHTQSGHGFDGALGALLGEIRSAFRARDVVLVAQDVESLRELLWSLPDGDLSIRLFRTI